MTAGARVALYGLLLAALFAASLVLGDLLAPTSWVEGWIGSPGRGH
ncbi:MAG: hypothetical protein ACTHV2_12750 [Brachybacterium sp.]|nr:hypothetical protein [Brachybacterium sp.]MDN6301580.1 hypothetical protein [Brachybacterium sp.]MDN6327977.1 hypothetical protein [Brachybacterium sp.]